MKDQLKYIKEIRVLYVEDNKDTREEVVYFLENRVSELYVAKNGEEGFKLYKEKSPDLVISDIQMPKLDGIRMSELIKEHDTNAKIILLTAFNDSEYLLKAIKLHIDNYAIKPLNIKELFSIMAKMAKNILLDKENKDIYNTLSQYKEIVDERSIVFKTNKAGIITYINKPFEKISGYLSSEVVGRTPDFLTHKDMDTSVFKKMWQRILDKKSWSGIVKNKKKDGDYYIIDMIVKPILDTNGDIQEFIALSNDITDLENSKEYFKKQSILASSNLEESILLAKLYEEAIDKSNIILKINTDKKITYANEAFYTVSGYNKEELIGKDYSIIRNKNVPISDYKKTIDMLESHLSLGKIWKGKTIDTKKDGSLFYCNITIYPMTNKEGEIVEYLGIRHDITEIKNLHKELEQTQREIVYKLGEVGETRSKETGNHVRRVAEYSKLLALKYGLSKKDVNTLFTASPMHDIGKVGIPDEILNKPGRLTSSEWDIMRTHSKIGYDILKTSKREILQAAALVSYTHHEKWDGSGYPKGLKGDEIHIFGRITALADVFDALGSDRCYKKAWEIDKILKYFNNQSGKHFDPKLVDIFMNNLEEFFEIRDLYKD
ncbi:PAS domain S-box protein [Poseidonibacter lekithochrous]|uniref:HD domain-containing phosphohydrolase n=1 Tax=Poseidonibacter TaxID=2321187 RepID=UPI001C08489C|nr:MULTISPECIES: HD domain-containing phosphohydrolase [Poseidonibacter]MBU3014779.1 PAS domain S-box protein [Poseidonibacter lekithochrous]MDO6828077.1 PAS domain S-box protein [Poseidonibacter sp. 1_MG-2023]